ncbi:sensor histidine kinase [Streptacidiphilus jiangxiensis]|uniref:Two-component system, NarL family, sensor kinase n=1 Tax=Streptacidiphilus jiangxiensis TaxID=235985 RepID=A0A1H7HJ78_STRJI|nr:ATP-binding protein [Streptacidiphilus jiangxiensis]SEK48980.1 two-component system, NarL family, sensor kinase [Streptacidiphilus jiangxiensis]
MKAIRIWSPGPPDAADKYAVEEILRAHQQRALRVQAALRASVVVVALAVYALIEPREHPGATLALILLYAAWSAAMMVVAWRGRGRRSLALAVPLVDLPLLTLTIAVAGDFTDPNWSSPFSADAFVFVPILAAFQLRPRITAVSGAAATLTYAVASGVGHLHAGPDLQYTVGHALFVAMISVAGVVLSLIQQSRVQMITELARQRSELLARTVAAGDRERRDLAEALHDGPLQNVLAARLDLDEARDVPPEGDGLAEALGRAEGALRDAARQLRSSVTELHPAVLERAGVARALEELALRSAGRGGFEVRFTSDGTTAGRDADRVLYQCGRELLANIVRHARAGRVEVLLELAGPVAVLEVRDDGVGLPPGLRPLGSRLAEGHIGLAAQRVRVEEAGGTMVLTANAPKGTAARITLPLEAAGRPPGDGAEDGAGGTDGGPLPGADAAADAGAADLARDGR